MKNSGINFILGKKLGMSQLFDKEGKVIPVTLVKAGPCIIVQKKTLQKDGYWAVQLGFLPKAKGIKKPQRAHVKKHTKKALGFKYLREFRAPESLINQLKEGQEIKVGEVLKPGDKVKLSATTKAKGFQGVIKRHGFKGAPATHGTKHALRSPGSIGSSFPERVFKGKKMPGRMGGKQETISNLLLVKVDEKNNLVALKGSIPGPKGSLVKIEKLS